MKPRINAYEMGNSAINALHALGQAVKKSSLDQNLLGLMCYRVSQINGCAFCLDMHAKDLRAKGESEQRLYVITAWREAPFYSEKERVALACAEALTTLESPDLASRVFENAKEHFSESELVDLTMAIIAINSYNRINIAFGADVGTYQISK